MQQVKTYMDSVLTGKNLTFSYANHGSLLSKRTISTVIHDLDFNLLRGDTLGVLGESGCGKSTLVSLICRDRLPARGEIWINNRRINELDRMTFARSLQVISQDTLGALDPRMRVGEQIKESLDIHKVGVKASRKHRVLDIMRSVSLKPELYDRFPHQLSGGQRQRVAIARALIIEPEVLICDEPVSALDVSVQAQVLDLLLLQQQQRRLSMVFISHDVRVVKHVSHHVAIMQAGRIVETGKASDVFTHAKHPYTQQLLAAVPQRGIRTDDLSHPVVPLRKNSGVGL